MFSLLAFCVKYLRNEKIYLGNKKAISKYLLTISMNYYADKTRSYSVHRCCLMPFTGATLHGQSLFCPQRTQRICFSLMLYSDIRHKADFVCHFQFPYVILNLSVFVHVLSDLLYHWILFFFKFLCYLFLNLFSGFNSTMWISVI